MAPQRVAVATGSAALRSRAFVKVQDGCDHRCTYCIVWRGARRSIERSRPTSCTSACAPRSTPVTGRSCSAASTSARTAATSGPTSRRCVESLLDVVRRRARIRLSSINANDVTPALIALNAHPRLCSHWHMPLQSGSDHVPARHASRLPARAVPACRARAARREPADTEFTTDIMVGFPGETEDDHAETLSLVDEVGFLQGHVFRWSPRPGTPATGHRERAWTMRRPGGAARRCAAPPGAPVRDRSLARAGSVHEVAWDAVDGAHCPRPHRRLSRGHRRRRAPASARERSTCVRAEAVEGDRLRGTLLRS